jgi:hypothetical protein
VGTITDSHDYRTKKDHGFDVIVYDLSVKVTDTTLPLALMPPHGGPPRSGIGVNGCDVSVKVAQLSGAPHAPGPEKQP